MSSVHKLFSFIALLETNVVNEIIDQPLCEDNSL